MTGRCEPEHRRSRPRGRRDREATSLDHFGTGHGSPTQLRRIRLGRLNIDRSLVAAIPGDRETASILRAVVRLGRSLGHEVIADGVETQDRLDVLRRLGCAFGQGPHFGPPLPAPALEPVLRAGHIAAPRRASSPAPAA